MKKLLIENAQQYHINRVVGNANFDFFLYGPEEMNVSDGYHTFDELYDHRITLWITLCKYLKEKGAPIYRSKKHSDGNLCFGTDTQFILGLDEEKGKQISYHIPIERWDETEFAETLEKAPEWDGHTSSDVLERLKKL